MPELKTCPFCGIISNTIENWDRWNLFSISCENKKCKVHPHTVGMDEKEAIEAWNKRVG